MRYRSVSYSAGELNAMPVMAASETDKTLLSPNFHTVDWIHLSCNLEKAMAPYSSTLAWKIPWTEEPGRLQSMESLRVGHN